MSNPFSDLAPTFGSLVAFRAGSPLHTDGADDRCAWTKENAHSHDLCCGFFKSVALTVQGQWGNRLPIGSDTTERIPLCWFFVCFFGLLPRENEPSVTPGTPSTLTQWS